MEYTAKDPRPPPHGVFCFNSFRFQLVATDKVRGWKEEEEEEEKMSICWSTPLR